MKSLSSWSFGGAEYDRRQERALGELLFELLADVVGFLEHAREVERAGLALHGLFRAVGIVVLAQHLLIGLGRLAVHLGEHLRVGDFEHDVAAAHLGIGVARGELARPLGGAAEGLHGAAERLLVGRGVGRVGRPGLAAPEPPERLVAQRRVLGERLKGLRRLRETLELHLEVAQAELGFGDDGRLGELLDQGREPAQGFRELPLLGQEQARVEGRSLNVLRRRSLDESLVECLLHGREGGRILEGFRGGLFLLLVADEDGLVLGAGFGALAREVVRAAEEVAGVDAELLREGRQLAQRAARGEIVALRELRVPLVIESQRPIAALGHRGVGDEGRRQVVGLLELVDPQEHLGLVALRPGGPFEVLGQRRVRRGRRLHAGRKAPGRRRKTLRCLLEHLPRAIAAVLRLVRLGLRLGQLLVAHRPHGHAQVLERERPVGEVFAAGGLVERFGGGAVVLGRPLDEADPQAVVSGRRFLVAAELPDEIAEAIGRKGIVAFVIGFPSRVEHQHRLLVGRQLPGVGRPRHRNSENQAKPSSPH